MVHEANEAVKGEGQGGRVEAGMEAEVRGLEEVLVEKDAYVMLGVVDEGEGADGAGRDAEVTLQAVLGGEGELALVEAMLDGMNVHRAVAGKDDEVVTVALVIAEEEVLAEVDVAVTEDFAGYVEGGEWGMLGVVEGDVETSQEGVEWGGTDHGGRGALLGAFDEGGEEARHDVGGSIGGTDDFIGVVDEIVGEVVAFVRDDGHAEDA